MMKAVMLMALLVAGSCLSTYTYSFNQNVHGSDWKPFIDLTGLTAGEVITFDIYFFLDTGNGPDSFYFSILNSLGSAVSPQPAGFSSTTLITFNTTITLTWTVPTSGSYIFAGYPSGSFISLVPYYINITSSNGNSIAQRVGILRLLKLYKNVYIGNATDYTITCTACNSFKLLNNIDPANFRIGGTVSPSSSTSNSKTYTALAAGYYII